MVSDEDVRAHEREVGSCGGPDNQHAEAPHETDAPAADERASSQPVAGSAAVGRSGGWASRGKRGTSTSGEGGAIDHRPAVKAESERAASSSPARASGEDDADEAAAGGGAGSGR